MVPFADFLNHENVHVEFDCVYRDTDESILSRAQKDKIRKEREEKKAEIKK